jgi:hypothetical protein
MYVRKQLKSINAIDNYLVEVQTTLPLEICNGTRCFRSEILILILSKYYNAASLQKEMEQEADCCLIALQRYFEDQKIVRLPQLIDQFCN